MKKGTQKTSKKIGRICAGILLFGLSALILFPVIYMLGNSFMSPEEVTSYYGGVFGNKTEAGTLLHLIPDKLSLSSYYQILLRTPNYLLKFWSSLLLCGLILVGQLFISCMGGFAFAKYRFTGKKLLFFFMILLMMMPIQVTLVPNYLVLDWMHLLNSWWALILPMAFSPFGTFLMTQIFKGIPDELIDAARLDGASTFQVLFRVMVSAGKGGVISLALLCFVDAWNMVEQPIVFLNDMGRYPLSVFLAGVNKQNFPLSFSCGVLAALPVLLLFLFFHEELVEGIEFSGIK